ncbi:MAG: putative DNA binding domain-containing protein [Candidatus Jorgensenbacteria bacterium]|nr:putative DNA binding domain-containing protein [Candidatus Jorgensenbacteria bacterium]
MAHEMVIRRSPIVFIRNFALIEAIAFVVYFLSLGGGGAKYELYNSLFLAGFLPYQTAKVLFLSGVQFVITVFAFLSWYYERYVIRPNLLIHEHGVFIKGKEEVRLTTVPHLRLSTGFFDRLSRAGTLTIDTGDGKQFPLRTISSFQRHFVDISHTIRASPGERPTLSELLAKDEYERLEFKSSLRFDHHTGKVNRELEKATMKSVAAFLNSDGGRIVVGIDDAKRPVGLEYDYRTIQKPSSDGFENHFTQVFRAMIGPEFRHLVKLWFEKYEGKDVCVVDVAESARPVYLKAENTEHFFVRTGNTITALKLSEAEAYSASRWPERTTQV